MPDVEPPAHFYLSSTFAVHAQSKLSGTGQGASGQVVTQPHRIRCLSNTSADSEFGKRDTGEARAEVNQFGVDAGVEVDVADAAAEIADVELGLGDGGDADRLMVSARKDLGCADARLHHRAVERIALGFGAPIGPHQRRPTE